jgi:hypothetical protein
LRLAQHDTTIFKSLMAGEHCPHGFINRDMREQLTSTRLLRSCADDAKKASAKVTRCFRGCTPTAFERKSQADLQRAERRTGALSNAPTRRRAGQCQRK